MKKHLLLASIAVTSLFSALTLLASPDAAMAATASCESKYTSAPVASDKAKAKAADLLAACNRGARGADCSPVGRTANATAKERKDACAYGETFRAENPSGDAPKGCGDISTNILKCDTNGGDPVTSLLLQILNFAAVGVGIAVIGGIVWGGMLYASSNGDSGKVNQGKTAIVNSIIGLLLFIFMYAILNFIVPGGLFR